MSFLIATGNLGRDAELRITQGGTKVLSFSIADEVGFGDNKTTQWLKCALWGKRAESLARYLTKGVTVEVCGTPKVNAYQTTAGENRAEIEVNVLEIRLHGGKADKGQAPARSNDMDDSIPFNAYR